MNMDKFFYSLTKGFFCKFSIIKTNSFCDCSLGYLPIVLFMTALCESGEKGLVTSWSFMGEFLLGLRSGCRTVEHFLSFDHRIL